MINDKYYGMLVADSKEFEEFAAVANVLDPSLVFFRAKNYYMWEPNDSVLPKAAINYRWKYIPICLLKICKQMELL